MKSSLRTLECGKYIFRRLRSNEFYDGCFLSIYDKEREIWCHYTPFPLFDEFQIIGFSNCEIKEINTSHIPADLPPIIRRKFIRLFSKGRSLILKKI